jgi:hypothetical protein
VYATSPNPTIANSVVSNGSGNGAYTANLTGLLSNTTYYVRAYVTNANGTYYANEVSFTTANIVSPIATDPSLKTSTTFTATWNVVPEATAYEIDVYTKALQSNQTIAAWTFPNTTDDNSIDEYNINNSGKTITGQGFSTINPPTITYTQLSNPLSTTSVVSSTGWDAGNGSKFWQIDINTTGASQMKLSSVQRSSNTGPRDFKVQYKVGAGASGQFLDRVGEAPAALLEVLEHVQAGAGRREQHHIAGLRHRAQAQAQRLDTAIGDDDVIQTS